MRLDKNFDAVSERFARRIHGSAKGQIRSAVIRRDLEPLLTEGKALKICDLGAGLGQFAIELASAHQITYVEVSEKMSELAKQEAENQHVLERIHWLNMSYQEALTQLDGPQDLFLCHALLEWLADPEQLLERIRPQMRDGAYLSLCFYNPDALTYRNLIRGNFDWLDNPSREAPNDTSLTPTHPCSRDEVFAWLADHRFEVGCESGIRVFSDYVVEKRGGLKFPEKVLAKELEYSQRMPFKLMGRYIHVLARKC